MFHHYFFICKSTSFFQSCKLGQVTLPQDRVFLLFYFALFCSVFHVFFFSCGSELLLTLLSDCSPALLRLPLIGNSFYFCALSYYIYVFFNFLENMNFTTCFQFYICSNLLFIIHNLCQEVLHCK